MAERENDRMARMNELAQISKFDNASPDGHDITYRCHGPESHVSYGLLTPSTSPQPRILHLIELLPDLSSPPSCQERPCKSSPRLRRSRHHDSVNPLCRSSLAQAYVPTDQPHQGIAYLPSHFLQIANSYNCFESQIKSLPSPTEYTYNYDMPCLDKRSSSPLAHSGHSTVSADTCKTVDSGYYEAYIPEHESVSIEYPELQNSDLPFPPCHVAPLETMVYPPNNRSYDEEPTPGIKTIIERLHYYEDTASQPDFHSAYDKIPIDNSQEITIDHGQGRIELHESLRLKDVSDDPRSGPTAVRSKNDDGKDFRVFAGLQNPDLQSESVCELKVLPSIEDIQCSLTSRENRNLEPHATSVHLSSVATSSFSRSGSETSLWSSSDETDWEEDETGNKTLAVGILAPDGDKGSIQTCLPDMAGPVLSKAKQDLVDRLMREFWHLFRDTDDFKSHHARTPTDHDYQQQQDQNCNDAQQQAGTQSSSSNPKSDSQSNKGTSPKGHAGKRKRQGSDDDENNDGEKQPQKKTKDLISQAYTTEDSLKFACPFRKHDSKKYCVRQWRSCALTPLETVARVKAHLYRHHRIFPCQRCKTQFGNQQGVTDHLLQPEGCKLVEAKELNGLTNDMVDKLRTKKKAHRDQSEADRWREIYKILFLNEDPPSPYFEEIQEDIFYSPSSQELSEYEEYSRQELPRVFRVSLETLVNNSTQPIEAQLRSQLVEMIRDAQDQVSLSYRASSATARLRGSLSSSPERARSLISSSELSLSPVTTRFSQIAGSEQQDQPQLLSFLRPPSPRNDLEASLPTSAGIMPPPKHGGNDQSDSGYDSSSSLLSVNLAPTSGDPESDVNTSPSSSQTLPVALEVSNQEIDSPRVEQATPQVGLDSTLMGPNGNDTDNLNIDFDFSQSTLDFELEYQNLSEIDFNYEFHDTISSRLV